MKTSTVVILVCVLACVGALAYFSYRKKKPVTDASKQVSEARPDAITSIAATLRDVNVTGAKQQPIDATVKLRGEI